MRRRLALAALLLSGCGPPLPTYSALVRKEAGRDAVSGLGVVGVFREQETLEPGEGKRLLFAIVETAHPLPPSRIRDFFERTKARVQAVAPVTEVVEEPDGGLVRYLVPDLRGELEVRVRPSDGGKYVVRITLREVPSGR